MVDGRNVEIGAVISGECRFGLDCRRADSADSEFALAVGNRVDSPFMHHGFPFPIILQQHVSPEEKPPLARLVVGVEICDFLPIAKDRRRQ